MSQQYIAQAQITVYDHAPEMTKAEADLTGLDQNKYYPVCFYLVPNTTYSLRYRVRIRRVLNASHGTVDFSAHANKAFALAYEWEVNPSGWGSSPIDRRVHIHSASLVKAGEAVASHPDQYTARSVEFVYLRGGSRYLIEIEGRNDLRVEAYPRGVTLGEDLADRYQLTLAPLDSIADRLPKTDIEAVEERVAREYIKTAEHNAKIADLQRQIDGEISNWFGAGVPTPSGYPADQWTTPQDKQRHIGDTFTTTDNFPLAHAGKSWRWMGTAWTEIADSDAIRALNAAREARATANGKTTTYLTRPNAYQVGDSWVLSTDQQVGATQYTRGAILFATASSATFNASHWVRYDTYITEAEAQKKVNEVQIGTRNLVLASGTTHDKTDYLISRYTLSEQWQVGQTYSISIWAEIYGNPTPSYYAPVMVIYTDRGSRAMGRAVTETSIQMTDGAYRGVWTLTGVFTSAMASSTLLGDGKQLGVYLLGNSPATVRCVIKRISVVNGNRPPLDWAPAPEDVADEAYKKAQAYLDTDYLRKVIKEGKTTIEGGLLATNVIALSPAEGDVSAYVNGDPAKRVAFAAGVAGFGTPQESRVVEIMHDGNASLGDVHINPNGRIEFKRPSDEGAYMTIGGEIGALSSLISKSADVITSVVQQGTLSEAFIGTDEPLFPTTDNGYQRVRAVLSSGAQRATVGMKIRTRGQVELHVNSPELVEETGGIGGAGGFSPSLGGHTLTPLGGLDGLPTPPTRKLGNTLPGSISVSLALKVGGVSYSIGTYNIATSKTETFNVDHTRMVDTEGAVTLEATITSWLHNRHQSARVTLRGFTLSGEKRHEEFNSIHFAHGGAVYLYSADRYVYISKADSNVMSIGGNVLQRGNSRVEGDLEVTGAVTMSGSLARGEVSQTGRIVWCSGPRAKPADKNYGESELLSDKTYKVYHNIGHTQYSISIMPQNTRDVPTYIEKTGNYFRIAIKASGNNTNQVHAFTYSLEGDLTAQ